MRLPLKSESFDVPICSGMKDLFCFDSLFLRILLVMQSMLSYLNFFLRCIQLRRHGNPMLLVELAPNHAEKLGT